MLKFKEYIRPESLDEAYHLNQKRSSRILGGMMWLKMSRSTVGSVIDLSGLGLDYVNETESEFSIGAMTSLRTLETHAGLNEYTDGAVKDCLSPIVGVQFRNTASVGGTVFGRFGFSDLITLLLALDAKVEMFKAGVIPIADFVTMKRDRDILVRVIIEKKPVQAVYLSQRNTKTDFPVLTCAAASDGKKLTAAIGARPGIAKPVCFDMNELRSAHADGTLSKLCEKTADGIGYSSNIRAGADYRRHIAAVLMRRACETIIAKEDAAE